MTDKTEDKINSFERILKIQSEKNPVPLYYDEKPSESSKVINPQDVIQTVSKQLRDIQRADTYKTGLIKRRLKEKNSDFVSINNLFTQATHHQHINKFETQCITDTQLVDMVENVEAMFDINVGMTQEFGTPFYIKQENSDIETIETKHPEDSNCISINNKHVEEQPKICKEHIKTLERKETECVDEGMTQKFEIAFYIQQQNLEIATTKTKHSDHYCISIDSKNNQTQSKLYKENINIPLKRKETEYIDEINTCISKEFEEPYYDAKYTYNTDTLNIANDVKKLQCNNGIQDLNIPSYSTSSLIDINSISDNIEIDIFKEKYMIPMKNIQDRDLVKIDENSTENTSCKDNRMTTDSNSTKSDETEYVNSLESDLLNIFDSDSDVMEENSSSKRKDKSISPVFNKFKIIRTSKTPPLVVALDDFEKFESLAMPLVKQNLDSETTKHIINSQLVNNQLLLMINAVPVLQKPNVQLISQSNCNPFEEKERETFDKIQENYAKTVSTPVDKKGTNSSFEDEIIFSSDEEYVHYEVEDLPMTCATKTSFYDEETDLDKSIFVGFQTCSNKAIQVDKESFVKAESIYKNIEKQYGNNSLTLTELDIYDNNAPNATMPNAKNTLPCKQFTDNSYNQKETFIENDIRFQENEKDKSLHENMFCGFKTANGKLIDISSAALNKCKHIFKDIEIEAKDVDSNVDMDEESLLTVTEKINKFKGLKTAENNIIKLSEASIERPKNIFRDTMLNNLDSNKTLGKAKCKNINDVEKNLNILDQTILNEFENCTMDETILSKMDAYDKKAYQEKLMSDNYFEIRDEAISVTCVDNLRENKVVINKNKPCINFIGFRTANNNKINISTEALAKTKDVFNDVDIMSINEYMMKTDVNIEKSGKKRVSGSPKDVMRPDDENLNSKDVNLNHCISKTDITSNKKYDHSKDMLARDFSSSHNKCGTLKDIRGDNSSNLDECTRQTYEKEINNPDLTFRGFKTTSNKMVKISDDALLKTKRIFQDIETISFGRDNLLANAGITSNNKEHVYPTPYEDFEIARNSPESEREQVLKTTEITNMNGIAMGNEYDDFDNQLNRLVNIASQLHGFKTASNRPIKVSNKALIKTKDFFKNIDGTVETNDNSSDVKEYSTFQGFKTANNKSVMFSHEALSGAIKIFQSINETTINYANSKQTTETEKICGVSTSYLPKSSNNKQVLSGSEKNNSRDILDVKAEKVQTFGFKGFQTASNKCVKVSNEALAISRKFFDDNDLSSQINKDLSDKQVKISDAISASEDIVDINTHNASNRHVDFKGFQTASNKCVKVSEDALARSRRVLADIELGSQVEKESCNKHIKLADNKNTFEGISENKEYNVPRKYDGFKGFQTASKKCVTVSDEALAKSRKIFDDIELGSQLNKDFKENARDTTRDVTNTKTNREKDNKSGLAGFKTGTNKSIKISEDSLKKSRQLFADLDTNLKQNNTTNSGPTIKKDEHSDSKNERNIDNILNTQVIENFETSLHTDDFYKDPTPNENKRSTSPILSCRKAKMRKFATPYRKDNKITTEPKIDIGTNKKNSNKYTFQTDYKKSKIHNLKDIDKINETKTSDSIIDPYILNFEFDSLLNFEFEGSRNELTDVRWTTDNLKCCFYESVNKKIIPDGWLDNHLRLIIWKLISYEIRFPNAMKGVCSVRNVLEQLKYRYDRELYRVERPVLRKIMEKDDVASRTMVLAVVGVLADGVKINCVTNKSTNIELILTDGWYCIRASADRMLARLVGEGRVAVGRKLATVGAELVGCEEGVSPWENTSSVRLKLFGNSTRPARWDARLGLQAAWAMRTHLATVDPAGGKVSKTRVLVARVYPALYVEKFEDGSTVTRSERLENLHQMKYESDRQVQLEKIYEEVEKEFFDQDSSGSEGTDIDLKKSLQSGSQINKRMKMSKDPLEFRSYLTPSQTVLLQEHTSRRNDKVLEELQRRVQERVRSRGLHEGRSVVPLVKMRVAALEGTVCTKAMVSIWRPNDAILDVVKEGAWLDMINVIPTGVRNSELQISAGRQSVFNRCKYKESDIMKPHIDSLIRKCFSIADLARNPTKLTMFNEVDTVGIVFLIEPSTKEFDTSKCQQFQNVYLTDLDKNFVCVNFWGGIKKFGYENIFDTGNIVACLNLQKRAGNTRKSIPQYRGTELAVFTITPKLDSVRNVRDVLAKKFSGLDKRKFCDDCVKMKNNISNVRQSVENISPYRFNTSDYNLTKSKMFIDSPLVQKDMNLKLTGLDFESTFKQTDNQELSPALLKRKRSVEEKIAKLKMYGEPPPLAKIYLVNKSINAGKAYKSPLTADVSSVARTKDLNDSPIAPKLQSSPILCVNRNIATRYNVNPVKLNFSSTSIGDGKEEIDPFEEEFDASLPLSLE